MAKRNKVIRGTRDFKTGKQIGIVKTSHPAGFAKMRCSACHQGLAILTTNNIGQKVYKCQRCQSEFTVTAI